MLRQCDEVVIVAAKDTITDVRGVRGVTGCSFAEAETLFEKQHRSAGLASHTIDGHERRFPQGFAD